MTETTEAQLRSTYAVRCGVCERWTPAKGPKAVKSPRCKLHRGWRRKARREEDS